MHFQFVDAVVEQSDDAIVTLKQVSNAEEYLLDHFPGFPVLPGVFMVESMVQAARRLMESRAPGLRLVLGSARAVKYGRFVRPGDVLRSRVSYIRAGDAGAHEFKGEGLVGDNIAVSGRFSLRPINLG